MANVVSFGDRVGPLQSFINHNLSKDALRNIGVLPKLSSAQRMKVIAAFKQKEYRQGEIVARQGDYTAPFAVVRDGCCGRMLSYTNTVMIRSGAHFSAEPFLQEGPQPYDIICASPTAAIAFLSQLDFESLVGPIKVVMNLDTRGIFMRDLIKLGILGVGAFGNVRLVQHRKTQLTYALKCLNKHKMVQHGLHKQVMNEKGVLASLDHPFLCRLVNTYQDKNNLYMLLELCQGGELSTLLHKVGKLERSAAAFYAGLVVMAVDHMHVQGVIHRDLHTENLLLDNQGYIKIVDFGFAKSIGAQKTFTICGCPEYIAPEVLSKDGYNKEVDWWALGILLYEMQVGFPPFGDVHICPVEQIYKQIMAAEIRFPNDLSPSTVQIICKLLRPRPQHRLGNKQPSALGCFQAEAFFTDFAWNECLRCERVAPHVLPVRDKTDTQNFGNYLESHEEVYTEDQHWFVHF